MHLRPLVIVFAGVHVEAVHIPGLGAGESEHIEPVLGWFLRHVLNEGDRYAFVEDHRLVYRHRLAHDVAVANVLEQRVSEGLDLLERVPLGMAFRIDITLVIDEVHVTN